MLCCDSKLIKLSSYSKIDLYKLFFSFFFLFFVHLPVLDGGTIDLIGIRYFVYIGGYFVGGGFWGKLLCVVILKL